MKPVNKFKMPQFDFLIRMLNSRSEREKQAIVGFLILLVFAADYTFLIKPSVKTFSQMLPKLGPLRQELKDLKEDAAAKEDIQKKWEESQKLLTEHSRALIAPDETPLLLENLSQLAQRSGLKILSLQPQESPNMKAGSLYAPFPITLKGMAGTHEIGSFLNSLETGPTFFSIKDLKINSNPSDDRKHVVELWMEAYKQEK